MGSVFGRCFRVTTFGESHGRGVGCVVDGCPGRLSLREKDIQVQLDRRRPGQSRLTTPRQEADRVDICSGVEGGVTLGTPILLYVHNRDQRPGDYLDVQQVPRPSHADFTYRMKYGVNARSGGGRASARETIGRVAAGGVADALLRHACPGLEIVAWVSSVGHVESPSPDLSTLTRDQVDQSVVRCPHPATAAAMEAAIERAATDGDSLGGVIRCVCRNVPPSWGEPVFDKTEALLAHAMLSIPACKGFAIGSGFAGTKMKGSEHNDPYILKQDRLGTVTNHSGGVQGGITNGEAVVFDVAFKPVATIMKEQQTAAYDGTPVVFRLEHGRHDPCVLPRAVPIVESMAACVLADLMLLTRA